MGSRAGVVPPASRITIPGNSEVTCCVDVRECGIRKWDQAKEVYSEQ